MTFPQYGNGCQMTAGLLKISKVGAVRVVQHRPLEGRRRPVRYAAPRRVNGSADRLCRGRAAVASTEKLVGIDVGLLSFSTLSTGECTPCPTFVRTDEHDLKRTQRKLSAATQGTPERRRRRKIVGRVHERIANRRRNFAHQASRRVVNRFEVIAVEDLSSSDGPQSLPHQTFRCGVVPSLRSFVQCSIRRRLLCVNPAYTFRTVLARPSPNKIPAGVSACVLLVDTDRDTNRRTFETGATVSGRVQEAPLLRGE